LHRHGILLILDEVVTAYGRTGEWFAAQYFGLSPDIVVTAKGITSGYSPLGAVLMSDEVGDTLGSDHGFPMGYTYNGHPTACAIAMANLDIIEDEGLLKRATEIGDYLNSQLEGLLELDIVGEVRHVGMMLAVELVTDKESRTPLPMLQPMLPDIIRRETGVIVRDCAHNLVLSPPLIMTHDEADQAALAIRSVLERTGPDGVVR
jgi:putrescine aminotransferase